MKYNTDINSFGGIQDYHMIHEALRSYLNDEQDFKERVIEKMNLQSAQKKDGEDFTGALGLRQWLL